MYIGGLELPATAGYKFCALAFIHAGVMAMRQILLPIGALGVLLVVGLAASFAAPAPRDQGPCGQITAACEHAGFAKGAAQESERAR